MKELNEDLGHSCGGFSTKIHALVDAFGNPVKFALSLGNDHNITRAKELQDPKNTSVLGDEGYVSKVFVNFL
ncbi:MAG: transposase [Clostridiales bacterium]|nr:transposase [Clostridiales bacterium]